MKHLHWDCVLHDLGVLSLVGFLCWLFQSGWPCLALFFLASGRAEKKEEATQP